MTKTDDASTDPFDPNLPYMQKMLELFEALIASGAPLPPEFDRGWAAIKNRT